jgi:hypothetical protein
MEVKEIVKEASKLSDEQRDSIASQLLHSLDVSHQYVSDEEVSRRMDEAEQDPSVLISFDEFVNGVQRSGS